MENHILKDASTFVLVLTSTSELVIMKLGIYAKIKTYLSFSLFPGRFF